MEMHILKSSACLAILLIFYKIFLEKETIHNVKRWFLLFAVVISGYIPFLSFTTQTATLPVTTTVVLHQEVTPVTNFQQEQIPYVLYFLWTIYGLGAMFFGIRFIYNLISILLSVTKNPKTRLGGSTVVLLKENTAPYTFWNFIFVNRKKYDCKQIPQEVIRHEQAHAEQRHSIDILFIELLLVVFWFNPFLYMVKRAIKLNHEFLADSAVIKNGVHTAAYQKILLDYSLKPINISMVNSINYQSIKKRFLVMKKTSTKQTLWIKSLVLLPVLTFLVYSFSTTVAISQEKKQASERTAERHDNKLNRSNQKAATPEMIEEYNMLARHYSALPEDYVITNLNHYGRMRYILSLMSPEQKRKAEKMPDNQVPPPPPAPAPAAAEIPPSIKGTNVPPPPPPPIIPKKVESTDLPTTPPSPVEHLKELAKKKFTSFYYDRTEITAEEAIELVGKKKNLKIHVTQTSPNSWNVQIFSRNGSSPSS